MLFRVLFMQCLLFETLLCLCCCCGKVSANLYDRLFAIYSVLVIFSLCTYVWAFVVRYQYTSKVCSGDFIGASSPEEEAIVMTEQIIESYYMVGAGNLLMWYLVLESIFVFCCVFSAAIWTLAMPRPLERISTSVEFSS